MKTTAYKLMVLVTIGAVALAASVASACPTGGYGGGYKSYSSYSPVYVKKVYVAPVYTCYRPLHSLVWVLPGDTWATISQREYGSTNFFGSIAAFNGVGLSNQLVVGQPIRLPEIHPTGALTPSTAPAAAPLVLPAQGMPQGIALAGNANGFPQGLPNGLPNVLPNMMPNGLQGAPVQQNFIGTPNGSPMNSMPTGGGSPMVPNGSPLVTQNFASGPMANGSVPPMNGMQAGVAAPMMNGPQAGGPQANGQAPIGPMFNASAQFASMNGSNAAPVNMQLANASAPITPVTNSVPSANIRLAAVEPAVPSVGSGSELVLDGQTLGIATGSVRLRFAGVALKVEVLDWSAAAVKIRLPELDLASATKAELEVLRADGSLASKSAVELKPVTKLAQGN